jgi:glycosyltransferase involved in cell wall biosynthesis
MKFLIICYCYPPDEGPRAYRWSAITRDWARLGHEVHVVSVRKGDWPAEEIRDGVHVHRVAEGGLGTLRVRAAPTAGAQPGVQTGSRGFRLLKRLYDATWKKVYWPDSNGFWRRPAARRAIALADEIPFDALVSVSTPYTGHMAARAVVRRFPGLTWLVDVGDPFGFSETPWNNQRLYGRLNLASERKLFAEADAVSVTVQSCKDIYAELFPGEAEKITVIPPLYSGEAAPANTPAASGAALRLAFTGSLYSEIRHPGYLMALFARARRQRPGLEIHFYGRINDCAPVFEPYREMIGGAVHLHGFVSRDQAAAALDGADILINIGNDTTYQLPSKLVDYAATGKPIVNIIRSESDSSVAFLERYPAALNLVDDGGPVGENTVARFLQFVDAAPGQAGDIGAFMRPYLIDAVSSAYLRLLSGN